MKLYFVGLLLCAACGGSPHWPEYPADFYGADLVIEQSDYVYTQRETYVPYLRSLVERTAAYYGHAPEDVAGLRIMIEPGQVSCGELTVNGCFTTDDNTVRIHSGYLSDMTCSDGALLPHELLHYFLHGDPGHTAPEWARLPALQDSLRPLSICP